MKLVIELNKDTDPNVIGETILQQINPHQRWGYMTRDTAKGIKFVSIESCPVLDPLYNYVEDEEEAYRTYPSYYYLQLTTGEEFYVGLHWDGDGYLTIHSIREGWTVGNTDCKKSDHWNFED